MKVFFYSVFLLLFIQARSQQKKLFVAAGQSNAVGMGDSAGSVQAARGKTFEYRFTGNLLKPLADPVGGNELHFERAHTGSLWPAFANEYSHATDHIVVMVQAARGGSSCDRRAELSNYGTWDLTGNLALFDSAVEKIKAAEKKTGVKISGIIWSQGERDANAINTGQLKAAEYQQTLITLIGRFRKALGEHTPFYLIQTGFYIHHAQEGFDAVRKVQEQAARELKGVYIVYDETGGFGTKGWMKDEIHYSQPALNDIGKKIATQIIRIEKNKL